MENSYEYDEGRTTDKSALIGPPGSSAPPPYEDEAPATQPPSLQPPSRPCVQIEMGHYPQQVQVGGSLPQTSAWIQGSPMPQVAGEMPAMVAAPRPSYPAPHDFFILALVTTTICGILIWLSLVFGIPAIIFGILSINARNSENYPRAKKHGRNALILTVLNVIFVLFLITLSIGVNIGASCANPERQYYSGGC